MALPLVTTLHGERKNLSPKLLASQGEESTYRKPTGLERQAFGRGTNVISGIGSIPGNIYNFGKTVGHGIGSGLNSLIEGLTGQQIPAAPEISSNLTGLGPKNLPTSESIHGASQSLANYLYGPHANNILQSQNIIESGLDRFARSAPTSVLLGGTGVLPAVAIGSATGAAAEAAGLPTWAQNIAELAGNIGTGYVQSQVGRNTFAAANQAEEKAFDQGKILANTIKPNPTSIEKSFYPITEELKEHGATYSDKTKKAIEDTLNLFKKPVKAPPLTNAQNILHKSGLEKSEILKEPLLHAKNLVKHYTSEAKDIVDKIKPNLKNLIKRYEPIVKEVEEHSATFSRPTNKLIRDTAALIENPNTTAGQLLDRKIRIDRNIKPNSPDKDIITQASHALDETLNTLGKTHPEFGELYNKSSILQEGIQQGEFIPQSSVPPIEKISQLTAKKIWDRKQRIGKLIKPGAPDEPILVRTYKILDSELKKIGEANPKFGKIYNQANDITRGLKSEFGEAAAEQLSKSPIVFNKDIWKALSRTLTRYSIDPILAFNNLRKSSPEIRKILYKLTGEEVKKHPEVAVNLLKQFDTEVKNKYGNVHSSVKVLSGERKKGT